MMYSIILSMSVLLVSSWLQATHEELRVSAVSQDAIQRLADMFYFKSVSGIAFSESELPQRPNTQQRIKEIIRVMLLDEVIIRGKKFTYGEAADLAADYAKVVPFTETLYAFQVDSELRIVNSQDKTLIYSITFPHQTDICGFMEDGQLVAHVKEQGIYVWDVPTLLSVRQQLEPLSLLELLNYIREQNTSLA